MTLRHSNTISASAITWKYPVSLQAGTRTNVAKHLSCEKILLQWYCQKIREESRDAGDTQVKEKEQEFIVENELVCTSYNY